MPSAFRRAGVVLVPAALLLASCGEPSRPGAVSAGSPAASPRTTAPAGAPPVRGEARTCTGEAPGDARLSRIPAGARVVGVLVCRAEQRHLLGAGEWAVRVEARPRGAMLTALALAYARPDAPPPPAGTSCTDIGYVPPDVQFDLGDGTTIHAAMPGGGCGRPPADLLPAVEAALQAPGARVVRLHRTRSEAAVAANCGSQWKDVLTGIAVQPGRGSPPTVPAEVDGLGVCRYVATGDGALILTAAGAASAAAVRSVLAAVRPGRRRGRCPAHAAGAVAVQAGQRLLAFIETGGCGRLVDADFRSAGWLPPSVVDRLAAGARSVSP